MAEYYETYERLGGSPTITFGCAVPEEIVGPIKPRSVQYGITYGNDSRGRPAYNACPTVWINVNKYRPDLPPWQKVKEFVVASRDDDGEVVEVTFIGVSGAGIDITGDLKTINLVADGLFEGTEHTAIIDRYEVAKRRDMVGVRDGGEFEITEELR